MGWLDRWRRARVLKRADLDETLWRATLERLAFTRTLSAAERARLKELVVLFLDDKAIHGAGGLAIDDGMRLAIAVQACILILNLDLDYYRGWVEIIVYPDEFIAEYEYVDEDGVAHSVREPMTGESWERGPLVLSWADIQGARADAPYNVVVHEFAHKLDMLNGDTNGFPPLHAGMSREEWAAAFSAAYADLCGRADRGEETAIDPYAAESPAEFFAVASEAFIEAPAAVLRHYPDVYRQLALFYRQDPVARAAAPEQAGAVA
jgi:Mlc titration factor MtfA (ptsG expression regulator)